MFKLHINYIVKRGSRLNVRVLAPREYVAEETAGWTHTHNA